MSWLSKGLKKAEHWVSSKIPHTTAAEKRASLEATNQQIGYYQQAKAEIDLLNKTYTDQKYYLHQIDFISQMPVPMPMMRNAMVMAKVAGADNAPLSIGNKVELNATVVLAAMPDQVTQRLTHNP